MHATARNVLYVMWDKSFMGNGLRFTEVSLSHSQAGRAWKPEVETIKL
jgi:hypothetical protein